ncbi:hypothetical protein NMY22_g5560 [Coprinellus aureogranulatus]|nr:hypothetical protein NMY22_g5560 [Coprinellus aureogranulatus]
MSPDPTRCRDRSPFENHFTRSKKSISSSICQGYALLRTRSESLRNPALRPLPPPLHLLGDTSSRLAQGQELRALLPSTSLSFWNRTLLTSPTMLSLPPEMHSHIAFLCCISDTGATIRSLSEVSKYFNAIARPYLFHTVSVTRPHSITLLDTSLRNHASSGSHSSDVQMKNLFIGMGAALAAPTQRILSLGSSSLRNLTLDFSEAMQDSSVLFARVFRMPFPHLVELTLIGFYPNPTVPSRPPSPRSSNPPSPTTVFRPPPTKVTLEDRSGKKGNFPLIKRLHLSGNRNPTGLFSVGSLSSVFPSLEELEISGLSMAIGFAEELREAVRKSPRESVDASLPAPRDPKNTKSDPSVPQDSPIPRVTGKIQSSALPSLDTGLFGPHLPHTLRVLKVRPAPALQRTIGSMVGSSAVLKDESMNCMLHGLDASCAIREALGDRKRVRFELLERGCVEGDEVWERWKSACM